MHLKGGMLIALRYGSTRYTKDVDFSAEEKLDRDHLRRDLDALDVALAQATAERNLGVQCRVQGSKIRPPRSDADFPTVQIRIGYAPTGNTRALARLREGKAASVLAVDWSFNEPTFAVDELELDDYPCVLAYGIADLVAEKLRALIQQVSRDRLRRQDPYDLWFVLRHCASELADRRRRVLETLVQKCASRHLSIGPSTLTDPEIWRRAAAEYDQLSAEITGELPSFDQVRTEVCAYYASLPWPAADGP